MTFLKQKNLSSSEITPNYATALNKINTFIHQKIYL